MSGLTIVTGASAGIGEGFARTYAKQGATLMLVARRKERLEKLAADLGGAEIVEADLATDAGVAAVLAAIGDRPVERLINNAGSGLRGNFAELDGEAQAAMIRLNCISLMALSRGVLPGMIARKAGGILNVASTASFQPGPWMATYYATKAFVLSLSEAMHEEVKDQGVRVAAICPGPTLTEFADHAGMDETPLFKRFAVGPEQVVKDGIAALEANQAVKISGLANFFGAESVRFAPRGMVRRLAGSLQKVRGA
jgi:short-subunit dehydrogenase